jgi:hypothetical protein
MLVSVVGNDTQEVALAALCRAAVKADVYLTERLQQVPDDPRPYIVI